MMRPAVGDEVDQEPHPIISEASLSGASLVTIDRPTGEMHSSPVVWKK